MSLFAKFLGGNDGSHALGVDVGSSSIKVVELKKKNGQAILETYGELSLGPYAGLPVGQATQLSSEKVALALLDLLKENEVAVTTKKCGLSIPFSSSLMSVADMPDVGPERLKTMVPLEARKYIPVPIQEVLLDWSVIPKDTDVGSPEGPGLKRTDVLIVAIHNDTIARYQDIITRTGLEASFFEIEVFSTMRSVLDEGMKPILIIDMGSASTKLYIVERGIIRGSHTINRGAQDITSALSRSLGQSIEEAEVFKRKYGLRGEDSQAKEVASLVLDHVWGEANSSLLAFEKKHNKTVAKVIMVGGGASLKGILDVAKENFRLEVELGAPFNKVVVPAFLENMLRETGPEFAVAVGLALRKLSEDD